MTVTSGCGAWAVGTANIGHGRQIIEQWNGSRWAVQRGPVYKGHLNGVSALSPTDAWAVGESGGDAVFEHWDGKVWRRAPSPLWSHVTMGQVIAISRADVWAVGEVSKPTPGFPSRTLIVHWDGRAWRRVPSPDPATGVNSLWGLAATSGSDVWAAGCSVGPSGQKTLIAHWDGRRWSRVPSPDPLPNSLLNCLVSISATSADDVWAAGSLGDSGHVVTMHWDGSRWRLVPNPGLGLREGPGLTGVLAVSPTLAWAVGSYSNDRGGTVTLAERWNGTAWRVVRSQNPGGSDGQSEFTAAARAPSGAVWALGFYAHNTLTQRLYPLVAPLP
jgi:hypothetical protein